MNLKVVNMPNEDPQGQSATSPGGPETGSAPLAATPGVWQARLSSYASWLAAHLRAPRTRLCLVGLVLLLAGLLWITSSVWTLPLIVVGIVMIVIAWVGSRLDGRFAVEWGEGGAQLELRAQIKPPPPVAQPVRLSPIPSAVPVTAGPPLRPPARSDRDEDVIDGEGHTVEIDVTELKLLIRAAEAREAANAESDARRSEDAPDASQRRPAA